MRFQPTAGGVASSGTVCGLGVTDALELELDAVQIPWLIDELEEVRSAFEEELQHAPDPRRESPRASQIEALERARDQLQEMLDRDPSDHYAHHVLGRTFERLGQPREALRHLRIAAAMRSHDDYVTALRRVETRVSGQS